MKNDISTKVHVHLKREIDDSYDISIGHGNLKDDLSGIIEKLKPTKLAVITDNVLYNLYKSQLENILKSHDYKILVFRSGESSKNMNTILELFGGLASIGMDRKSLVVAFGGGVCGDMAGFVASIYMRGISFIQVPTSLLSMVDSSVGGKTGVDTRYGKNMAGAFYQPRAVVIDTLLLDTLPEQEFINGMAEVIKYGLIGDKNFFSWLSNHQIDILQKDPEKMQYLVQKSCQAKALVVEQDEKEGGLRQTLNLGHTIGHAIEHVSRFRIPHGFAISLGMAAAAYLSTQKAALDKKELVEILEILRDFQLFRFLKDFKKLDLRKIWRAAASDKKNISGATRIVLLDAIGRVKQQDGSYSFSVSESEFLEALEMVDELFAGI